MSRTLLSSLELRPEREVAEETEKCWKLSQLQNEIDCLKLKRQGVREPFEQLDALDRELDCLGRLYQLATELNIFTFQFILNNILDDGFKIASKAFKLHLKQSSVNPSLKASRFSVSTSKPTKINAFLNRMQRRQESQQSFLQRTALTKTKTAAAVEAAATAETTTAASVPTAGDFWLPQLHWFAQEGARFVWL